MNRKNRKKKYARNLICILYCSLQLLLVLALFKGAGWLIDFFQKKDAQQVHSAGILFGDDADEEEEDNSLFTVCLDAGHGGKDNGSDANGRIEKNDTLKITKAVAEYMSSLNIKVILTREEDIFLSPEKRAEIANSNEVDYFVSLHRNKGEGAGVEIWVRSNATEESNELADTILQKLDGVGIQRNRGVKHGTQGGSEKDYYINSHANMPTCLIELGFLNDNTDNRMFDDKLDDYAKAIGDAVHSVWQSQRENSAGGSDTAEPEEMESLTGTENSGVFNDSPVSDSDVSAPNTGHTENWPAIENVSSLDSTSQDWGQGVNVDDKNRPTGSLTAQSSFGKYEAYFIVEDSDKIFLTFDEGYEYGCTESILNTLKEKGVKAVFFVTEPYAKDQPELVARMIEEGHTVGNHSVTHPSKGLPSQTLEQQQNEVMGNHQYIKDNFGYEMHLFRYPAGKFSEQSLAAVHNCGYKSVFWSFAYLDYDVNNQPDKLESLKKMTDKLHPGAIYLLHAESTTNTEVLGEFIDRVRAEGYEFAQFD